MTEHLTSSIRGAWNADTTYQLGVVVWHSGQAWASTIVNNLGIEPDGIVTEWQQVSQTGAGSGTVTNVATTAPITGGPITNTGTIAISTFGASGVSHARGAVPDPGAIAGTTKFLREDASWQVPAGSGVTGSGASPQVGVWSGASTLTGFSTLTFTAPTLTVSGTANTLQVSGSATTVAPSIVATGTDANIPIKLAPKMSDGSAGQGFLQVGPETAGPTGWAGFALGTEFRMTAATSVAAGSILTGHDVTIQGAAGMFPVGISTNISGEDPASLYLVTTGTSAGAIAGVQNHVHGTGTGALVAYAGDVTSDPGATPTSLTGLDLRTIANAAVLHPTLSGVATSLELQDPAATVTDAYLFTGTAVNTGAGPAGATTNFYGFRLPTLQLIAAHTVAFYSADLAGTGTSTTSYAWFDSRGVRVVREAGQAIDALHNPAFTKYTPGLANYERVVTGQWNANVAEIGTEAGGTGTLRPLRLIGASVELPTFSEVTEIADPAAPAANKARLYARDNGAGKTQLVVRFPTGAVQVIATEP